MKNASKYLVLCLILLIKYYDADAYSYMPASVQGKVKAANKSGVISLVGTLLIDTFTVTSSTPTIQFGDYARALGYTKVYVFSAIAARYSGPTVSNTVNVMLTGCTDTSVTYLLTQPNTATINVLGFQLLGAANISTPDPTNVKISLAGYYY